MIMRPIDTQQLKLSQ